MKPKTTSKMNWAEIKARVIFLAVASVAGLWLTGAVRGCVAESREAEAEEDKQRLLKQFNQENLVRHEGVKYSLSGPNSVFVDGKKLDHDYDFSFRKVTRTKTSTEDSWDYDFDSLPNQDDVLKVMEIGCGLAFQLRTEFAETFGEQDVEDRLAVVEYAIAFGDEFCEDWNEANDVEPDVEAVSVESEVVEDVLLP